MDDTQHGGWRKKIFLFLTSQCITLFGSTLVQMALVWYAAMQTSSGGWVAAFTVCSYLPQFLISFLGGVWANESWGRYWGWDPKETWSLITIVAYTVVLHVRLIKRFNTPYIFSVASTLGFYAVLMTYFGVNFYLSGKHSYASGEPVPIPTFLYIMVAVHIILIVLSYFKRNLNTPELESKKEENK